MAIRLRQIRGTWVALCAAATSAKPGDVYLDDAQDHALRKKLREDWDAEFAGEGDTIGADQVRRAESP